MRTTLLAGLSAITMIAALGLPASVVADDEGSEDGVEETLGDKKKEHKASDKTT